MAGAPSRHLGRHQPARRNRSSGTGSASASRRAATPLQPSSSSRRSRSPAQNASGSLAEQVHAERPRLQQPPARGVRLFPSRSPGLLPRPAEARVGALHLAAHHHRQHARVLDLCGGHRERVAVDHDQVGPAAGQPGCPCRPPRSPTRPRPRCTSAGRCARPPPRPRPARRPCGTPCARPRPHRPHQGDSGVTGKSLPPETHGCRAARSCARGTQDCARARRSCGTSRRSSRRTAGCGPPRRPGARCDRAARASSPAVHDAAAMVARRGSQRRLQRVSTCATARSPIACAVIRRPARARPHGAPPARRLQRRRPQVRGVGPKAGGVTAIVRGGHAAVREGTSRRPSAGARCRGPRVHAQRAQVGTIASSAPSADRDQGIARTRTRRRPAASASRYARSGPSAHERYSGIVERREADGQRLVAHPRGGTPAARPGRTWRTCGRCASARPIAVSPGDAGRRDSPAALCLDGASHRVPSCRARDPGAPQPGRVPGRPHGRRRARGTRAVRR